MLFFRPERQTIKQLKPIWRLHLYKLLSGDKWFCSLRPLLHLSLKVSHIWIKSIN